MKTKTPMQQEGMTARKNVKHGTNTMTNLDILT